MDFIDPSLMDILPFVTLAREKLRLNLRPNLRLNLRPNLRPNLRLRLNLRPNLRLRLSHGTTLPIAFTHTPPMDLTTLAPMASPMDFINPSFLDILPFIILAREK